MKDSASDLSKLLDSLSGRHSRLGEDLARAAEVLRGAGTPPDACLLEDLAEYRQDFAVLRLKALEYADWAGAEQGYNLEEVSTLDDLRLLVDAGAAAEVRKKEAEEIRRRALAVLKGVEAVSHVDGTQFQPLEDRKAEARQLRRLLAAMVDGELPQESLDLAEGHHPLAALLAFVEGGDSLDDERWSRLQEAIEKAFGRPLAVAVSRGKLVLNGTPSGDAVPAPHPEMEAQVRGVDADVVWTVPSEVTTQEVEPVQTPETAAAGQPEATEASPGVIRDAAVPVEVALPEQAAPEAQEVAPGTADQEAPIDQATSLPAIVLDKTNGDDGMTTVLESAGPEETVSHGGELEGGLADDVAGETPKEVFGGERPGRQAPVYSFAAEDNSASIAGASLAASGEDRAALRDLVWRLLLEEKSSLAYHLSRAIVEEGACAVQCLPPTVVRQAILGPGVRYPNGDLAAILREDFAEFTEDYFAGENSDWDHAVRFLLVASALRPALLAPGTGASTVLRALKLKDGLDRLYSYCSVIADHGDDLQPLDTVSLRSAGNQGAWDAISRSLRAEVEEWFLRAFQKNIIYHQATRVWRSWLEPGELIDALLQPVRRDDPSRLQWAKEEVDRLTEDAIGREIDRTDRQKLGRRVGQDITARAVTQLRSNVREAVAFVRRWIELQENRPGPARGFLQQQAEALRSEVRSRHAGVVAELNAFAERNRSPYVSTAITYCRRAMEDVLTLFDPEVDLPREEPPADRLLNADLLRLPSVRLDDEWGVAEAAPAPALIDEILRLLHDGVWDWRATFEARSVVRDHEGTLRVIELLEASGGDSALVEELRRERESRLEDCRAALAKDIEDARRHLGDAVAFGLLREQEHNDLTAEILSVERALPDTLLFSAAHARLSAVRERLAHKKEEEREVVRQRLGGLEARLRSAPDALERIRAALDKGDVHTANEYIEMTLAGLPLPDPAPQADTFTAFFPQTLRQLFEFLEQSGGSAFNPVSAVNEIRRYASAQRRSYALGPVDMDRVPGSQARQAADLLQAWFTAKRAHAIDAPGARAILDNLGLNTTGVTVRKQGRRTWVDVEAETVRDRNRCPVPQYGSMALGRYRVLCVWERPSEEDMLSDVADSSHGRPVILFYFGRMTEPRRRELARLCRERRKTFVVVDDALVCYLCGVTGSRLRVMFDCALPFTFLEPYTTTAGLVPPEMFYGRERERDSVGELMGSCFIYGGRQLGKTALLRDDERTFHAPERGRVALWLDLKSHGIGYDRPVDDLWSILAGEFKRLGVLPATVPAHIGVDKLLDHVQAWVAADNDRRILLLLDESDRFLDYDGREEEGPEGRRGFVRAARLKGLMDRTNRRFKVIFAGLHNVQRTTKLEVGRQKRTPCPAFTPLLAAA
jgi:hypothetical protein